MSRRPALFQWLAFLAFAVLAAAAGQERGAQLVKDANRASGTFRADIGWVMPMGAGVVFAMDTLANGSELWTSDGTPGGTRLLKDIEPGPGASYPENPVAFGVDLDSGEGTKVAFRRDRWAVGLELWVTDGTEAGTVRAYQSPEPGHSYKLSVQAGTSEGVFFSVWSWDVLDSEELLFTDGTEAGTWSLNPMEDGVRARFSEPYGFVTKGRWCYFIANELDIWRSDGTAAGTTKVATVAEGWPGQLALADDRLFVEVVVDPDIRTLMTCPLEGGEMTQLGPPEAIRWEEIWDMVVSGDRLFFITEDEDEARHLWASDGTAAGTWRIPLLPRFQEDESRVTGRLTPWKGSVYFSVQRSDGSRELRKTDGSSPQSTRVASFSQHAALYLPLDESRAKEDLLYFYVSGQGLWYTTGEAAGTKPVQGAPSGDPFYSGYPLFAQTGSGLIFAAGQGKPEEALWRLRGKTAGAMRLTRPEKATGSSIPRYPDESLPYEMLNGMLLTIVDTGRGYELWRMSPDGSGSRAFWKPPVPLSRNGILSFRGITATKAIFTLSDGDEKQQVWATDGTRRGTRLLAEHGTGTDGGYVNDFVEVGGIWFYSVINHFEPAKESLWKTDGSPGGTSRVMFPAGGSSPVPDGGEMVAFRGKLYFLSTGVDGKTALWCSDGTTSGTIRLKDRWYGQGGETATCLSVVGGKLIFFVTRSYRQDLWNSDGTADGTVPSNSTAGFYPWSVGPALDLGGVAVFKGRDNSNLYYQWWRHDDTGIRPVRTGITSHHLYASNDGQHAVAGTLLFYTGLEDHQGELWVTDGTSEGSRMVKDVNPGPLDSTPGQMLAAGKLIYFAAHDEAHGMELWRSDGTEAGTVLVADIEPGPRGSLPLDLKVMGGKLYFHAERRDVGRELFSIDLSTP